jgi:hypothetical protein
MNKFAKGLLLGLSLSSIMLLVTNAYAASTTQSIKALINAVSIKVNNKAITKDNILYNNKLYVDASTLSSSLNKKFTWDKKTNAVTINDIVPSPTPKPTVGFSRANPANIASKVTFDYKDYIDDFSASITVKGILRGSKAYDRIVEANMFNDEPIEGFEYMLVNVNFELIKCNKIIYRLTGYDFDLISGSGKGYEQELIIAPDPVLNAKLYEGASSQGYIAFEVLKTDTKPVITFGRKSDGSGGVWFKAYK